MKTWLVQQSFSLSTHGGRSGSGTRDSEADREGWFSGWPWSILQLLVWSLESIFLEATTLFRDNLSQRTKKQECIHQFLLVMGLRSISQDQTKRAHTHTNSHTHTHFQPLLAWLPGCPVPWHQRANPRQGDVGWKCTRGMGAMLPGKVGQRPLSCSLEDGKFLELSSPFQTPTESLTILCCLIGTQNLRTYEPLFVS